jgi:hypothetical protein
MNCKQCGKGVSGRKKFCSNKGVGNCKDAFHNANNVRGYGIVNKIQAESRQFKEHEFSDGLQEGWQGHKDCM